MKKSCSVGKYRVLALVALLCTVGLCFIPTFFLENYSISFPKHTVFTLIKDFVASFSSGIFPYLFPAWSLYPLFGAIVVSLVGFIVSLCTKNARKAFLTTATISMFFLSAFAAIIRYHMGYLFLKSLYVAPTLLAVVYALLLLIGANLDKKASASKTLGFIFASLSAVGVSHAVLSIHGIQFGGMGLHVFTKGMPDFFIVLGVSKAMAYVFAYGFTALLVVVAVNYFASIFTLPTQKGKIFSLIFNVLQVALSIALYVLCLIEFKQSFDKFGVYGLFAVFALGIAGIVCAATCKKRTKAPQVTATDADGQLQLKLDDLVSETTIVSEIKPEEAVETPAETAEGQISIEETLVLPAAVEPEITPTAEVCVEQPASPAPVYPTVEISEAEQPSFSESAQPVYTAPQQPYATPYSAMPVPTMQGNDYFYASLTPDERKQFDDLFIHCVLGENTRLPRYVVGGNNTEFFRKVFIFIGRFRAYISTSLLEKLYTHASRA